MPGSPLDFYQQHMWNGLYGCTRCGQLFTKQKVMVNHCKDADCEKVPNEEIEWLHK